MGDNAACAQGRGVQRDLVDVVVRVVLAHALADQERVGAAAALEGDCGRRGQDAVDVPADPRAVVRDREVAIGGREGAVPGTDLLVVPLEGQRAVAVGRDVEVARVARRALVEDAGGGSDE